MNQAIQKNVEPISADSAAELMLPMWEAAAMQPVPICSTGIAAKVLRAGGGFDVTRDLLEKWAHTGTVPNVVSGKHGLQWSPSNLITAAGLANASRRWLLNSAHVAKMSAVELEESRARQRGETIFTDLEAMDYRDLLGVIANPVTDHDTRSALCQALRTKLERAGIE